MTDNYWISEPPPVAPPSPARRPRGRVGVAALGVVGGVVAGAAITWGVVGANAASTSGAGTSTSATSARSATSTSMSAPSPPDFHGGRLDSSGTVTAVGASSVTIKTNSGTTTYKVTSSSDIDKNGEASLSDLKAGDAVTFDTTTVNGAAVIDKLHAGNEALDRPSH